jgi:hypothetical protein
MGINPGENERHTKNQGEKWDSTGDVFEGYLI